MGGSLGFCTARRIYKAKALGLVTGIKGTGKINASSNRSEWRARKRLMMPAMKMAVLNYAERLGGDEIGTLDEISAAS